MAARRADAGAMLTQIFEDECARLTVVRGAMVRTLAQQHARGLEKQAAAVRTLQRDLHALQADMDGVHQGLVDQLGALDRRTKPHWKFVPLQRPPTGDEVEAARSMQRAWRRRHAHAAARAGWRYMPPAERWALMHSVPLEEQQLRMGVG